MGMRRNKAVQADPIKQKVDPEPSRIEQTKSIKHCHQTSFRMGLVPMFKEFESWLQLHGAIRQQPTNSHELARYRVLDGTIIVYKRDNGSLTFTNGAAQLYQDFKQGRGYPLGPEAVPDTSEVKPVPMMPRKHTAGRRRVIASRDGHECWYCCTPLSLDADEGSREFATIEEVLARSLGGPTTLENQVLACKECNTNAGSKSVADKVRMRDSLRGYRLPNYETKKPDSPWVDDPVKFTVQKETPKWSLTKWLTTQARRLTRRRSS